MQTELDRKSRNIILILFLVGVFMGSLDTGIIGPVLPAIEHTYNLTSRESSWIYTLFVITFMIGTPVMAKLSDFYGRKKIFIIDTVLFAVGSALIAFSQYIWMVYLGRIIQGFGSGGLYPIANAFIGDAFPLDERGKALGLLGSVFGIAAIGGPLLGALLIPYGWNLCFMINLPISIAVVILALYILPGVENHGKLIMDYSGMIVLIILSTLLAFGLNQIDSNNFVQSLVSVNVAPFLLAFVIIFPLFIRIEKRAEESLVPIHLFKNTEITIASAETFCCGMIYSSVIFIPSLVMLSMGFNNQQASLMLLPILASNAIAAPLIGKILDGAGSRKILNIGTLLITIGLIILVLYPSSTVIFILAGCLVGIGFVTLMGSPVRYILLCEAKPNERGASQAIVNMLLSIGQLLGGALMGGVIASFSGILGFQISLIIAAATGVVAFISSLKLKSRDEQRKAMIENSS